MKRFKTNLSNYRLATMEMGKLVPVQVQEVLPGDSMRLSTSALVRITPQLSPVMHPVTVRIHHWFVPNRIVWDGWEDFITGGEDGTGAATPYPTNTVNFNFPTGSLGDYMGLPTGVTYPPGHIALMPFRAFNLIFNEWYRDEDLTTERVEDDTTTPNIAWEKDYFTRARPWAQKGPAVSPPRS